MGAPAWWPLATRARAERAEAFAEAMALTSRAAERDAAVLHALLQQAEAECAVLRGIRDMAINGLSPVAAKIVTDYEATLRRAHDLPPATPVPSTWATH